MSVGVSSVTVHVGTIEEHAPTVQDCNFVLRSDFETREVST